MYTIHSVQKDGLGIITGLVLDGAIPCNDYDIFEGDKFVVVDGDYIAPKFLSYIGQKITCLPVHFASLADMDSDASGRVFVPIDTKLCADDGRDKNISCDLVEGMNVIKVHDWVEIMPPDIEDRYYLVMRDMERLHDDVKRERYGVVRNDKK